ncbi:response regulator transcription factor [Nocardioides sp. SYSU DS0651]|uniref:response regulator transcription factor n=1 Tax=Nocardioides sp. SYSU DS0651 TaxID=3415955 RepID=UPI003F4BCFF1
MTTVLLADDEPLVRGGLRAILEAEPDIVVVGEAADGAEAVALARRVGPDVVLMDVRMPHVDGITATTLLARQPRPPKVVVVTTFENDDYVFDALVAGAHGFLLKRDAPARVAAAVRTVAAGEALLFPEALRALVAGRTRDAARQAASPQATELARRLARLTDRERDVLRLLAAGLSNAEIADRLVLGVETVKTHVRSVLGKLGVKDRVQAVILAYESGFVRTGT